MVAIVGRIMPAPLAAMPMDTSPAPSGRRNAPPFRVRSVVQMASLKSTPPSAASAAHRPGIAAGIFCMSSRSPITPVLETATCSVSSPSSAAVSWAMRRASSSPPVPVAAFAMPALTTTAWKPARARVRFSRTGADGSALVVSSSHETSGRLPPSTPRSRCPDAFSPQATPAATNPSGEVTEPPGISSSPGGASSQSARSIGSNALTAAPRSRGAPPSG